MVLYTAFTPPLSITAQTFIPGFPKQAPPFRLAEYARRRSLLFPPMSAIPSPPSRRSKSAAPSSNSNSTTPLQSSEDDPETDSPSNFPKKWSIVIAASAIHALHATAVYMAPSTLLSPMRQSLGLTVAEITRPLIAFRFVQALFLLPAGLLLDIIGPQIYLRVAIVAAAITAPLLPCVTSLPQLMSLQIFFGITKLFGGLSTMLVLVAAAFPQQKGLGTATGVLLSGYSFAGFLAPAVIGALSASLGWRGASMILSLAFSFTSVPLTFYFLREHPSSKSQRPTIRTLLRRLKNRVMSSAATQLIPADDIIADGASTSTRQASGRAKSTELSNSKNQSATQDSQKEPLFPTPYVLVTAAIFTFSFSMHIIFDHFLLFLTEDFGLPFSKATLYMSALSLIALLSKIGVGFLADRYNKSLLMAIFATIAGAGSLFLLEFSGPAFHTTTHIFNVMTFVTLYGIGYAAVFNLTTSVLPEFGKKQLGFRSNFNLMILFASGSLGSYVAAALRSATGTYEWAFACNSFVWILVIAAAMLKYVLYDNRRKPTDLS